jgi:hypothetical protein
MRCVPDYWLNKYLYLTFVPCFHRFHGRRPDELCDRRKAVVTSQWADKKGLVSAQEIKMTCSRKPKNFSRIPGSASANFSGAAVWFFLVKIWHIFTLLEGKIFIIYFLCSKIYAFLKIWGKNSKEREKMACIPHFAQLINSSPTHQILSYP